MAQQTLVRDRMSREPVTVMPDAPVLEAYELMRRRRVRRLPVADENLRLVGMVTRSDIEQAMPQTRAGGEGQIEARFALAGMEVSELMTRDVISLMPEQSIADAAAAMIRHKVSGLPVVEHGQVIGIITESDIFRLVVETWSDDMQEDVT